MNLFLSGSHCTNPPDPPAESNLLLYWNPEYPPAHNETVLYKCNAGKHHNRFTDDYEKYNYTLTCLPDNQFSDPDWPTCADCKCFVIKSRTFPCNFSNFKIQLVQIQMIWIQVKLKWLKHPLLTLEESTLQKIFGIWCLSFIQTCLIYSCPRWKCKDDRFVIRDLGDTTNWGNETIISSCRWYSNYTKSPDNLECVLRYCKNPGIFLLFLESLNMTAVSLSL